MVTLVNVDTEESIVTLSSSSGGSRMTMTRDEYCLSSSSLTSPLVSLNGGPALTMGDDGAIPALDPRRVRDGDRPLVVPPLTACFIVFPNAGNPACL